MYKDMSLTAGQRLLRAKLRRTASASRCASSASSSRPWPGLPHQPSVVEGVGDGRVGAAEEPAARLEGLAQDAEGAVVVAQAPARVPQLREHRHGVGVMQEICCYDWFTVHHSVLVLAKKLLQKCQKELMCPFEVSDQAFITCMSIALGVPVNPVPHARLLQGSPGYEHIDIWADHLLDDHRHTARSRIHLMPARLSAPLILRPKLAFPPVPYSQLFLLLKKTLFAEVTLSRL